MTPILLLLAFLLMLDVLILLGPSTTRETAGLAAARLTLAWPVGRCAHLTIRPRVDSPRSRKSIKWGLRPWSPAQGESGLITHGASEGEADPARRSLEGAG